MRPILIVATAAAVVGCAGAEPSLVDSSIEMPVATEYVTVPPPSTTTTLAPTTIPATPAGESSNGDDTTEVNSGPTTSAAPQCPTTYSVQEGDTSRIEVAQRFGITYEQMDAANSGTPGYENFLIGTEVIIPCPG